MMIIRSLSKVSSKTVGASRIFPVRAYRVNPATHGHWWRYALLPLVAVTPFALYQTAETETSSLTARASIVRDPNLETQMNTMLASINGALHDKRCIDEFVSMFEYDGKLQYQGGNWNGQGALKRGLSRMLIGDRSNDINSKISANFGDLDVKRSADNVLVDTSLRLTPSSGDSSTLHLRFQLSPAMKIQSLEAEVTNPGSLNLGGSEIITTTGPKWETNDGRTTQKIWQHTEIFAEGNPFLKEKMEIETGRLIVIIDAKVWRLYGNKITKWCASQDLTLDTVVIPGNENHKTMEVCLEIVDGLKRIDPLRRSEPVLAIGGGVVTDMAGFACAMWRRGIPYCRMPTTLLGMVDASVGIKVAVNYHRKNGVGHFYSPIHTFVDKSFLKTVEYPDIRSGCGEIMKAALIYHAPLFDLMEKSGAELIENRFLNSDDADAVIKFSVDTMLASIGPDLWEESLLRPMDFGHTFSRTLEANEKFHLRHGEAVAIDAAMSCLIAVEKGILPESEAQRVLDLYVALGLPISVRGITAETYKQATREIIVHRDGFLRAPLPAGIGSCQYVDEFTDDEIEKAFAKLKKFLALHPDSEWDPSKSFSAQDYSCTKCGACCSS